MSRNAVLALLATVLLIALGWLALLRSDLLTSTPPPQAAAMGRSVVLPAGAPAPIGPYSPAIQAGGWLFLSGQIGLDPGSGRMVEGGITPETRQVLANLKAVLEGGGLGFTNVVRATVYLADLDDYAAFNAEYAKVFAEAPPARVAVQVARLPLDARVEVSIIAMGASR